jgi:hypothetical protein
MNRLLWATIGGLVAGAIGAAVWAGVAMMLDRELGILAWALGGAVGLGVALGAKEDAGWHTGILAAVLSIAAICAGKYVIADQVVNTVLASPEGRSFEDRVNGFSEDNAKAYLADQLASAQVQEGKTLEWPPDSALESATELSDYPQVIVKDVEARWGAMDAQAKTDYTASAKANVLSEVSKTVNNAKSMMFLETFGLFDNFFFILAVGTSFRLGAAGFDS